MIRICFFLILVISTSYIEANEYSAEEGMAEEPQQELFIGQYLAQSWFPVPEKIRQKIEGHSYIPVDQRSCIEEEFLDEEQLLEKCQTEMNLPKSMNDLSYLQITYKDFNGNLQLGELICHQMIAEKLMRIFHKMFESDFRIANMSLIEAFHTDDTTSMEANNSSCLCMRTVTNRSWKWSNHSNGSAIDINPMQNPYYKEGYSIEPIGSEKYLDRSIVDMGVVTPEIIQIFENEGFFYGGKWVDRQDFMHFEYPLSGLNR